ncbi:hypothetical protein [uncultured Agathobaculum sp.]|uniref:hypothetical protein n=1 Tax=uncultured Agathobaculum sp. TaxID=2048140 RepID=UPI002618CE0D|nr:hypothetical protein [uncultured Agathobaculum sp.]
MRSARTAASDEGGGVPVKEFGTFRCGCRTDLLLSAVWTGVLLLTAKKNIVTAFGLTAVNHAVHLL